jgi:hypothetical protein
MLPPPDAKKGLKACAKRIGQRSSRVVMQPKGSNVGFPLTLSQTSKLTYPLVSLHLIMN